MLDPYSATTSVTKSGFFLYKNWHLIKKYIKKILAKFNLGKTDIIVYGRPSVGKSVLIAQMEGRGRNYEYEVPSSSREVDTEAVSLGKNTKLFRILPGQPSEIRTKGEIRAFENNSSLEGVIFVTDYGYTLPRDTVIVETLITTDGIKTVEELRAYNLKNEISDITLVCKEIERVLTRGIPKFWLIIAINKCDLFENKINDARTYYSPNGNSEFSKVLKNLNQQVGTKKIRIEVTTVCANQEDFVWNGKKIKSNLDNQKQKIIFQKFMSDLKNISEGI